MIAMVDQSSGLHCSLLVLCLEMIAKDLWVYLITDLLSTGIAKENKIRRRQEKCIKYKVEVLTRITLQKHLTARLYIV